MTAGSPPASVKVPAAVSSSTREISHPAKRLSSSKDFSSAPRREEAPAITMRWESRGVDIESRGARRSDAIAERANKLQNQTAYDVKGREKSQDDFGIFPDDGD